MMMTPRVRRFALTAHVMSAVGWLGAVAVSLVLAVAGLTHPDVQVVRATYLALEVVGWYALVPFSVASLLTGLVQSLGTRWGLVRHYWVLVKLLLNVVATAVLLLYTQTLAQLAQAAADMAVPGEALRNPSPVVHAGAALLVLLGAMILAVYKPRGLTPYGQRKQQEQRAVRRPEAVAAGASCRG